MLETSLFASLRLAAICAGAAILAAPAIACTCPPLESAAEQAGEADLVAVAKVGARRETRSGVTTAFTLSEVLKGSALAGDEIAVMSARPGNPACGILWSEGEETVLLASASDTGGYSAWMCSRPQFSAAEFRSALGKTDTIADPELAPLTGTLEIVSPQPGQRIAGVLPIKGTLPRDWFFENVATGELYSGDTLVGEIPISPISSQNWTEPGDKTIDLEVTLANTETIDLTLVISQSTPDETVVPRSIEIPFTAGVPELDAEAAMRNAVSKTMEQDVPTIMSRGDIEAYEALLSRDFVLISSDGTVTARDDLLADLAAEWTTPDSMTYEVVDIREITAATALVTGKAETVMSSPEMGETCTGTYASSHVFRRFEGTWSMASSHISGRETICE